MWTLRVSAKAWLCVIMVSGLAVGEEIIHLRSEAGSGGAIRIRGEVEQFDGRGLIVRSGTRQQEYPAERVERIEYEKLPGHTQAETLLAEGKHRAALALFREALDADQRIWVRREILTRMLLCYQGLEQTVGAAETFLLLMRSDPQSPYFTLLPLDWSGAPPTNLVEQKAREWLASSDPLARLLGASWLVASPERLSAVTALKELARSSDPRIRPLAIAQLWRTEPPTAALDLAELDGVLQQIPSELRGGPYYTAGRRLAAARQTDEALLRLLRVPIAYPQQRELAALALLSAANLLVGQQRPNEAATLLAEVVRDYRDQPAASEAERQLQQLQAGGGAR